MRVSSDRKSPHFWGYNYTDNPTIMADGVEVKDVVEADDVEGVVIFMKRNKGHLIEAGGRYVTDSILGKIDIVGTRRTDIEPAKEPAPPVMSDAEVEKITGAI